MADGTHATAVGMRRRGPATGSGAPQRAGGAGPLAAVAAAFTLAQLVLVRPVLGLGWDETVYVSQVTSHTPAAFFSAPRSRGVSLLVAPVASWSSSTPLLRVYLALLSGLALYLALRAWRGLFPVRVLATAGAFFATLWVTLFYGPQAMPNYWVAIGALMCAGCFLRARAADGGRAAPWGVAAGAALMAWMRPTDAVWVAVPLLLAALARRRGRLLLALVGGLAAGGVPWVIEAYTGYGGLAQRLADASRIQGGLGWHIAVDDQLRSLGGRS
ncbi:membrane protein, partial [Streptomyces leeuwenhoekii]